MQKRDMQRIPAFLICVLLSATPGFCRPLTDPPDPVENAADYKPLTADQRWSRYTRVTVLNPGIYLAALGSAAISQLSDRPPEWKQGFKGYARRSGSQLGTLALQATIQEGGAAMLGYEPRYIRSASKGVLPRFGHAIGWTFLTYDSNGRKRFNIPAVAGAYGSGMISTAWYPGRFTALHDGVRAGNQEMGVAVGVSILREFSPELRRFFHLRK
jgi:hypothetical protein